MPTYKVIVETEIIANNKIAAEQEVYDILIDVFPAACEVRIEEEV